MSSVTVAALYCFTPLNDPAMLQSSLKTLCDTHSIKGTLILAHEGINGTVSGCRTSIDALRTFLMEDGRFQHMEYKESKCSDMPFYRMKVLIKPEIVTMGVPNVNPGEKRGTYVDPKDWNDLISRPDTIVIDTRNDYECDIGTFKGAIDPNIKTFREFPEFIQTHYADKKDAPIAMFCTGGIRCERSTSYLLNEGFKNVFHLKGGILQYLEDVPKEDSLWEGDCFVFDQRTAVNHQLEQSEYTTCFGCREPLSSVDRTHMHYKEGVHCHQCYPHMTPESIAKKQARHDQILLAKQRGASHMGPRTEKNNLRCELA